MKRTLDQKDSACKRRRQLPRLTKTRILHLKPDDLKLLRSRTTNVILDHSELAWKTLDPVLVLSETAGEMDGLHAELLEQTKSKENKGWELKFVDEFTNKGIEQVAWLDRLLPEDWHNALQQEFDQPYWSNLCEFLIAKDRAGRYFYPPVQDIFAAFHATPVNNIQAVIIGQDCYHSPGQAHGLAFSVPRGAGVPSSLDNIYKEMCDDLGAKEFKRPTHGNLAKWASQGVLLLNTALTVTHQQPGSHSNSGWHQFTTAVLRVVNAIDQPIVFFAWGSHAQSKACGLVDESKHLLLTAAHPSGLSADKGFFGCKHFSAANHFLKSHNRPPLSWQL